MNNDIITPLNYFIKKSFPFVLEVLGYAKIPTGSSSFDLSIRVVVSHENYIELRYYSTTHEKIRRHLNEKYGEYLRFITFGDEVYRTKDISKVDFEYIPDKVNNSLLNLMSNSHH
jgi:hypothetical protein